MDEFPRMFGRSRFAGEELSTRLLGEGPSLGAASLPRVRLTNPDLQRIEGRANIRNRQKPGANFVPTTSEKHFRLEG